jgi:DNA-binding MarR family transcriptional regulator
MEGNMVPYILTTSEAELLRAISNHAGAYHYELASEAQLTVSEVNNLISELVRKRLAETTEEGRYVKLTDEGYKVRRLLDASGQKGAFRLPDMQPVVIIRDKSGREPEIKGAEPSEAELDAALEAAIERISNPV